VQRPLPTSVGDNRMNWDLRYDSPPAFAHTFEINANPGLTPPSPEGPVALPGEYTLTLNVNGRSWRRTVTVRPDPRSPATAAGLRAQHALQMNIMDGLRSAWQGYEQVAALRGNIGDLTRAGTAAELASAGTLFGARLDSIGGLDIQRAGRTRPGTTPPPTFRGVSNALVSQLNAQDNADMAPSPAMLAAYRKTCGELQAVAARWRQVVARDLGEFNVVRKRNGLGELTAPSQAVTVPRC